MGKKRLSVILVITVLGISLLGAGCGKKGDDSPYDVVEKASEEVKEENSEEVNGTAPEKANEEASDEVDEASSDVSDIVNEKMEEDILSGTYTCSPSSEQEECTFKIFRVCDNYYVEYMGDYDYAGAELQINGNENEKDCINYDVTMYAFSGFSFMGEYWGAGDDIQITAYAGGDVILGKGQPFFDKNELVLKRTEDACLHESEARLQKNRNVPEVLGTWRCISERDGEEHEITMIFSEDGSFKALNKVKDQSPRIYLGNYTTDSAENGIVGEVYYEIFAYGGMPDSWVLGYDEDRKCPYVYSDYMFAEPFTFKKGDDMRLLFEKIADSEKSSIAPGPGSRASEVQEMFDEIMGENSDSTNELTGVWQLSSDTPAGDPYIFQLEIDEDNNVSYCGYSLTGYNWFQNFCYDGTVTRDEDNSDILFELSEIDYNGTETDRITCGYNAQVREGRPDSLILEHLSGQYLGTEDVGEYATFVRADKAIYSGESL